MQVEDATTEVSLDALHGSRGTAFSSDNRHVIQIAHHDVRFSGTAKLFDLSNGETALLEGTPRPLSGEPTVPQFIHGDQLVEVQRLTPRFQWVAVCTATTDDFRVVWDARCISSNKRWCFREDHSKKKQWVGPIGSKSEQVVWEGTILRVFEVSPEFALSNKGQKPTPVYEFTFDELLYPRQTAISDDGRIVVMVSDRSDVMVVDTIDQTVLLEMSLSPAWIFGIYLSPNGRHIAATVQTTKGSHVNVIHVPNG